jgi:hypothetical protein
LLYLDLDKGLKISYETYGEKKAYPIVLVIH